MRWLITIVLIVIVIGGIMVLACLGLYANIKAWENIFNDQSRGQ